MQNHGLLVRKIMKTCRLLVTCFLLQTWIFRTLNKYYFKISINEIRCIFVDKSQKTNVKFQNRLEKKKQQKLSVQSDSVTLEIRVKCGKFIFMLCVCLLFMETQGKFETPYTFESEQKGQITQFTKPYSLVQGKQLISSMNVYDSVMEK